MALGYADGVREIATESHGDTRKDSTGDTLHDGRAGGLPGGYLYRALYSVFFRVIPWPIMA
jgi:hypothetical protein